MSLHRQRDVADFRSACGSKKSTGSSTSDSARSSRAAHLYSGSEKSYRTQPTDCSSHCGKPSFARHYTAEGRTGNATVPTRFFDDRQPTSSPQGSAASIATYASTEPEVEDHQEEPHAYEIPEYSFCDDTAEAVPATPSDFSRLFPSSRRLVIRHDDTTLDGNMNLRVDAQVSIDGRRRDMTLFHLRMHDLKNREFSLRRYCRDSGREVCHSERRYHTAHDKRPGFQRSLSNALSGVRARPAPRSSNDPVLKRHDSGYASMHSRNSMDVDREERLTSNGQDPDPAPRRPTNSIKLDFSNYAQVDIRRRAGPAHKKYEFEYWGTQYSWRKIVTKTGVFKDVSYHLTAAGSDDILAYVKPVPLTVEQAREESSKGGWIPPCSLWIADRGILRSQKDVADVVVATGVMALVDDTIRMRFHHRDSKAKAEIGVEYIGPKRFINEIFGRRDGAQGTPDDRPPSSGRSSATVPSQR